MAASSGTSRARGLDGRADLERRNFRTGVVLSCVLHAGVVGVLFHAPEPEPMRLPEVISVQMVALPGAAPAPPKALPKAARPAPEPAPVPARPPPPAPKKVILPQRAQKVSKKRKPKPRDPEYDDVLAALRDELGEPDPPPQAPEEVLDEETLAALREPEAAGAGARVDAEFARWQLDTLRHVRESWVVPPDFRDAGLATGLRVTLSEGGEVLGRPVVTHTSGNPYFDDETVSALLRATPLPSPPEAGDWQFRFTADEGP